MGNQSEPNAIGPQNTLDLIARRPLATDKVQMIMSFVATSAQKTYRSGRKDGILFYTFRDITHWADIETPERGGGLSWISIVGNSKFRDPGALR